jgi:hypothetical protein
MEGIIPLPPLQRESKMRLFFFVNNFSDYN